MPRTTAPMRGPNWPALNASPSVLGLQCRKSAILGSATPITVRSKPSRNVTRKQRPQTRYW